MKTLAFILLAFTFCACSSGGDSGTTGSGGSSSGGSTAGSTGGTSGSNCPVPGTYDSVVNGSRGPGDAVTSLDADGGAVIQVTLRASPNPVTTISGTYSVSGSDITFVNSSGSASNGAQIDACIGVPGEYSMDWSADCNQVTLHKVSDSCTNRIEEADGNTLTRQ